MSAHVTTVKLDVLEQRISSREPLHSSKSADFQTNVQLMFSNTPLSQTKRLLQMSQVLNTLEATLSKPHTEPLAFAERRRNTRTFFTLVHSHGKLSNSARLDSGQCPRNFQKRQHAVGVLLAVRRERLARHLLGKAPICARKLGMGARTRSHWECCADEDEDSTASDSDDSADVREWRVVAPRVAHTIWLTDRRRARGRRRTPRFSYLSVQRDEPKSEVAVGNRASGLAVCRDEVCKTYYFPSDILWMPFCSVWLAGCVLVVVSCAG